MKVRSDYVSNSSSSSFIIAYDPKIFGNLEKFIKEHNEDIGYNTSVYDIKEYLKDISEDDYYKEEHDRIKKEITEAKKDNKKILYFGLDYEHYSLMELLQHINKQFGGEKLKIISEDG